MVIERIFFNANNLFENNEFSVSLLVNLKCDVGSKLFKTQRSQRTQRNPLNALNNLNFLMFQITIPN